MILILAGVPGLVDSFARFALQGLDTPAPIAPTRNLVVTGLYRYVRNPIHVAVVAIVLGQAVLLCNWHLIVYGALFWLAFHLFVVAYEEPTLEQTFGGEYEAFRANVPRWLTVPPMTRVNFRPKNGGRSSQRVIDHGMSPANVQGATTKKKAEPRMAIGFCTAAPQHSGMVRPQLTDYRSIHSGHRRGQISEPRLRNLVGIRKHLTRRTDTISTAPAEPAAFPSRQYRRPSP